MSKATTTHPRQESSPTGEPWPAPTPDSDSPNQAGFPAERPHAAIRWWAGVLVGAIVALPLAWLLSYAAALPFFLGLFFSVLFGLIIGAATYRIAAPKRPYSRLAVLTGTTCLVLLTWGLSIAKEARDFPDDVAKRAVLRTRDLGGRTPADFRREVTSQVRMFLSGQHGPDPTLGYLRWVLADGQLERGDIPMLERPPTIPAAQTGSWWVFRVAASIALLAFGIGSQTFPLRARSGRSK